MTCPITKCRATTQGMCQGHTNQMRHWLEEIWIYYTTCDATPVRTGESSGKSSEPTIGVNVPALSWLNANDLYLILGGWERVVRSERELTPAGLLPPLPGVTDEVRRLTKFHQNQLEWIVGQPWAVDFHDEIRELHRIGMTAAKAWAEKQTRIKCPAEIAPGEQCGAPVTLNVASPLDAFQCRLCATEWNTLRLVQVAKEDRSKALWVDVETAAQLLNVSVRQVQRMARTLYGKRARNSRVNLHDLMDMKAA